MVEPQDTEEEKRKAMRKSRQAWLTPNGFQVVGLHSMEWTPHLGLLPPIDATTEVSGRGGAQWGPQGPPPHPLLPDVGVEGKGTVC